jgi:hypothetical protein
MSWSFQPARKSSGDSLVLSGTLTAKGNSLNPDRQPRLRQPFQRDALRVASTLQIAAREVWAPLATTVALPLRCQRCGCTNVAKSIQIQAKMLVRMLGNPPGFTLDFRRQNRGDRPQCDYLLERKSYWVRRARRNDNKLKGLHGCSGQSSSYAPPPAAAVVVFLKEEEDSAHALYGVTTSTW